MVLYITSWGGSGDCSPPQKRMLFRLCKVVSEAILDNFSRFVKSIIAVMHICYAGGGGGGTGSQK